MDHTLFNFIIDSTLREPAYMLGCGMNGVGKTHTAKLILEVMKDHVPRQLVIPSGPMDDSWHHLPIFPVEDILLEVTGLFIHQLDQLNSPKMVDERELFFYAVGEQLNAMDRAYRYPVGPKQRILFDAVAHPLYGLMNAFLVLDDIKKYIHGYQEDQVVLGMLGDRLHRDLNILAYVHDPSELAPYWLRKNPLLLLWATSGKFDGAAAKIKDQVMEELEAAQQLCNAMHERGKREGDLRLRGYCKPILIQTEAA